MIGHAYPVDDTGYSVLESGELDRASLRLVVTAWLVVTPAGVPLPQSHDSREAAEAAARAAAAQKSGS